MISKTTNPRIADLEWYSTVSRKNKLTPRCPLASSELCPRYYASTWLLGKNGISTPISMADQERLDKKWENCHSTVAEEEASMYFGDDQLSMLCNFCPEVAFQTFGHFATFLAKYSDEIDRDSAHRRLGSEGAALSDSRWQWANMVPAHYTECREYSIHGSLRKSPSRGVVRRNSLSSSVRWEVLARDSFTCQFCGRRPPEVALEVDHKISVAAGGTDDLSNLHAACEKCNRGKGAKSVQSKRIQEG